MNKCSFFKSQTTGESYPHHAILLENKKQSEQQTNRCIGSTTWKCEDYFDWSMNVSLICFLVVFFIVFVGITLLAL